MITQAGCSVAGGELVDAALESRRVVALHERASARRWTAGCPLPRAAGGHSVRPLATTPRHHGVVVAVVGAEDLHDVVAAGVRAGDTDRVHGRLRPRVREAPARQAEAARELLGHRHRLLRGRAEVSAEREAALDGCPDRGVSVPLHHRAEAVVEVDVLVAVDIPHPRALATGQVDGPGLTALEGGRNPAGERSLGAAKEGVGSACARAEGAQLTLLELADPLTVELTDGGQAPNRTPAPATTEDFAGLWAHELFTRCHQRSRRATLATVASTYSASNRT